MSRERRHYLLTGQPPDWPGADHLVGFLNAVDGGDVGVVEGRKDLRLPLEPGEPVRVIREGVGKDLQGDLGLSWVSVACQTCPMPPSPMRAVTS